MRIKYKLKMTDFKVGTHSIVALFQYHKILEVIFFFFNIQIPENLTNSTKNTVFISN